MQRTVQQMKIGLLVHSSKQIKDSSDKRVSVGTENVRVKTCVCKMYVQFCYIYSIVCNANKKTGSNFLKYRDRVENIFLFFVYIFASKFTTLSSPIQ